MAEALSEAFGDVSMPDVMRTCLRMQFSKAFPIYARKGEHAGVGVLPEELTPEQIVEMVGGRVEGSAAGRMAVFQRNGQGALTKVMLSAIGEGRFSLDNLRKEYGN